MPESDVKKATAEPKDPELLDTGIPGLNAILCGGLLTERLHLVEGDPGAGKTTMAMQFLIAGAQRGETSLFVTLSESERELRLSARAHGWDLKGVDILEIIPTEASLTPDARYTMYHPSEVELGETTRTVLAEAQRLKPKRLVFDSMSSLRVLAESAVRYRRQILALKEHFAHQGCTILFVDDRQGPGGDMHLQTIANSVISLEGYTAEYGTLRRRVHVRKMRGCAFREGFHDYVLRKGGMQVFPRLVASEHSAEFPPGLVSSGLEPVDRLLGGGLTRGTSTLIMGPAGAGKSAIATQYVVAAAARGERSAMFVFDESIKTLVERSAGLGMDVKELMDSGVVSIRQIDPAELSPGEFAHKVREAVESGVSLVVIDSLTGYLNAMPSERFLTLHLHELLSYLGQQGVTTLMIATQHGIIGATQLSVDTSYIADTVVLLRYFEAFGQVRQVISVIKKRTGKHEHTIRELRFENGLVVGPPIIEFHGVLSGAPEYVGSSLNSDGVVGQAV
jgi:circadian clock protein KaiC